MRKISQRWLLNITSRDIRRLTPRVYDYVLRITVFGQRTITIWYGQIADTIFINDENEEAVKELMDYVDKIKKNNSN